MFTAHSGLCSTYVSVNPFSHSRVPSVCMLLLLVANGRLKALCMWAPGQALPEHLLLQLPSALSSLRKDGCGAGGGGGGRPSSSDSRWRVPGGIEPVCPLRVPSTAPYSAIPSRTVNSTPSSSSPKGAFEKFKPCGWRPRRFCDAAFRHWGATSPHCRRTQSPRGRVRVHPALFPKCNSSPTLS